MSYNKPDITTDLVKLNKCYRDDLPPFSISSRIRQIIVARGNFLTTHYCNVVTADEYARYLKEVDNKTTIKSDNPEAALLGVIVAENEDKHPDWYVVQFEEYRDLVTKQESVV